MLNNFKGQTFFYKKLKKNLAYPAFAVYLCREKIAIMVSGGIDYTAHVPIQIGKTPRKYTLAEYLQREARSAHKHEFINGQIMLMPYAKGPHNIISLNIAFACKQEFRKLEQTYILFSSDQKIYFPTLDEGVYADALAVSEAPVYWDKETLLLINPLLVIEVLSRSTKGYDRGGKFDKYKTLPSFREYMLVEQGKCYVEVWFQEKLGLWRETITTDMQGMVRLDSVGISIAVADIYEHIVFPK